MAKYGTEVKKVRVMVTLSIVAGVLIFVSVVAWIIVSNVPKYNNMDEEGFDLKKTVMERNKAKSE